MSIISFHCILLNEFRLFVNVFVLVSSMCWKDNVLATASWDSTVKVGFNYIFAIKFRSSNSFKMFVFVSFFISRTSVLYIICSCRYSAPIDNNVSSQKAFRKTYFEK